MTVYDEGYVGPYIILAAIVVTTVIGVFLVIKYGQASPLADEYTMKLRRTSVAMIFGLGSILAVVLALNEVKINLIPAWLQATVIIAVIAVYFYLPLNMRKTKHTSQQHDQVDSYSKKF